MVEINLITTGGIAAVIAVIVQLLVKPALRQFEARPWHSLAVSAGSALLGVVFGFLGMVITSAAWDAPTITQTAVVGLMGGLLATGGYEGVKNIIDATQARQ